MEEILALVKEYTTASVAATGNIPWRCCIPKCGLPPEDFVSFGVTSKFLCHHHFMQFTREIAYPGILAKEDSTNDPH